MAPARRISRPVLLARRWAAATASPANDSTKSMVATTARVASAAATLSSTSSSSSSSLGTRPFSSRRSFASLPLFEEDVGQPTHETHPELLAPGELAPGVTPHEVSSRRDALAQRMEEAAAAASSLPSFFARNSLSSTSSLTRAGTKTSRGLHIAILPSPLPLMMAGVIPYPYRPEPDFYYLTGVTQPGCVAVVVAEEGVVAEGGGGGNGGNGGRGSDEGESGPPRRTGGKRIPSSPSSSKRKRHRFILFVPDECPRTRLWDGGKVSADAAKRVFGADEAFPMSQLDARLSPLLSAASLVLCDADRGAGADPRYSSLVEERLFGKTGAGAAAAGGERAAAAAGATAAAQPPARVQGLRPHTHSLRWVKSDAELALMRRSARMAAAGMRAAMAASHLRGGRGSGEAGESDENAVSERALAAAFEHEAKRRGADRLAYPPVVAGAARACTIHYSRNDRLLRHGDWLLMDAGCEFWGYASDVSRAWPVVGGGSSASSSSSSSPSPPPSASALFSSGPHSDVYHALLEVHARCVAACVPGTSLSELHALSFSLLAEAAAQLGGAGVRDPRSAVPALRGLSAAEIAGGSRAGGGGRHGGSHSGPLLTSSGLYPHAVGHWLGLDTHDAPLAGTSNGSNGSGGGGSAGAALVPNVALTIEPGLYFPADEARWGRLAGVGMRLEDDVAVRASGGKAEGGGPEVLSAGAPLLPADVAAAIDGSS